MRSTKRSLFIIAGASTLILPVSGDGSGCRGTCPPLVRPRAFVRCRRRPYAGASIGWSVSDVPCPLVTYEEQLPGGNVGGAVRVGDTVRRPAGRWTPTIQHLLQHIRQAGIEEVPEPLGLDGDGREMFGLIDGNTIGAADYWPGWSRSEATIQEVGRLLRRIHDASRGFGGGQVLPWRLKDAAVLDGEVVCHNDVAPYNLVWRPEAGVVGLIDWDFAAPGDPRIDVAFAVWQFAPLHHLRLSRRLGWPEDVDRVARARLLIDAYGLRGRTGLTRIIIERMWQLRATITQLAETEPAFKFHVERGDPENIERSIAFVEELRNPLEEMLGQ